MISADPLPIKAGEWQGEPVLTGYQAVTLPYSKYLVDSEDSTDSAMSKQDSMVLDKQHPRNPLENSGYQADTGPFSVQRTE